MSNREMAEKYVGFDKWLANFYSSFASHASEESEFMAKEAYATGYEDALRAIEESQGQQEPSLSSSTEARKESPLSSVNNGEAGLRPRAESAEMVPTPSRTVGSCSDFRGGDDTRELREAAEQLMDSAARLVIGYESGKVHRPDTHGCDSCAENVFELKEGLGEFRRVLAQGEPRS